ncbi:MAG: diaminopimelate dehydrogenase [Bacilli bacterium]|nr:diaminopimelate dehydrogenase [Bacilli bacterium]
MAKIRIGIYGYGNIGKGVELAVVNSSDMELVGIFSRRENISTLTKKTISSTKIKEYKDKIDVLILCGGSATDLPLQGPELLKDFNTLDSFDTHAKIPEYFSQMDKIGKTSNTLGLISVGWDPGILSIARVLFQSILPNGKDYTFWGKGVSQGHSDAIRRIKGVVDARQYTVPLDDALNSVRKGETKDFSAREKHLRECFVVLEKDTEAERKRVDKEIRTMPNYFSDYDVIIHFISLEELKEKHNTLPHAGFVIRSGNTYSKNSHVLELNVKLDSNPEFTSSIMVAYARALYRMHQEGVTGALSVLDIPLSKLSSFSSEELRSKML